MENTVLLVILNKRGLLKSPIINHVFPSSSQEPSNNAFRKFSHQNASASTPIVLLCLYSSLQISWTTQLIMNGYSSTLARVNSRSISVIDAGPSKFSANSTISCHFVTTILKRILILSNTIVSKQFTQQLNQYPHDILDRNETMHSRSYTIN